MSLSTEQVLLLENITYMDGDGAVRTDGISRYEGMTVADYIDSVRMNPKGDSGVMISSSEWNDIVNAVKKDPVLMNMTIAETHTDNAPGGGGGKSVIFVDSGSKESVVAFKGTESDAEWKDNFMGANMSDTPQQKNALDWYRDAYDRHGLDDYYVTVTGHSKGGNKAKYITVTDDSVDRCLSFDGQGFSDQFFDKYRDQIAHNQGKIQNHNIDYDYVNQLLNDTGQSTFYHGHNIGDQGFLENHSPNAFLKFDENGNYAMTVNPDGQAPEIQALDEFLNSYIRSLPESERKDTIDLLNTIMAEKSRFGDMSEENISFFVDLANDPKYADNLAYLAAYFIRYEQENPELAESIRSILKKYGMEDFVGLVDNIDDMINMKYDCGPFGTLTFDDILAFAGNLPPWLLSFLMHIFRDKFGFELSAEQIEGLLKTIRMCSEDVKTVDVSKSGKDRKVSSSGGGGRADFRVDPQKLAESGRIMMDSARAIAAAAESILSAEIEIGTQFPDEIRRSIRRCREAAEIKGKSLNRLSQAAGQAAVLYTRTEKNISSF